MTDTEIIIAETKRLMKENVEHSDGSTFYGGRASAFGELYSFMTSLPQEPASEDLDEAARNHAENFDIIMEGEHYYDMMCDLRICKKW